MSRDALPPGPSPLGGRYAYATRVRAGGQAVAWIARDGKGGGLVVCSPVQGTRLERFRALRGMRLEGLAPVLDVLESPSPEELPEDFAERRPGAIAVARHIDGATLHERILAGPVRTGQVVRWIAAAAQTLASVHARGVAHGALSPRSLVVSPREGTDPILSQLLAPASLAFCSPNRVRTGNVRTEDDCYALLAALFTALVGRPPVAGATHRDLLHNLDRPLPLDEVVDPLLRQLIADGLERSGQTPPATAIRARLEAWLQLHRSPSERPPAPTRPSKPPSIPPSRRQHGTITPPALAAKVGQRTTTEDDDIEVFVEILEFSQAGGMQRRTQPPARPAAPRPVPAQRPPTRAPATSAPTAPTSPGDAAPDSASPSRRAPATLQPSASTMRPARAPPGRAASLLVAMFWGTLATGFGASAAAVYWEFQIEPEVAAARVHEAPSLVDRPLADPPPDPVPAPEEVAPVEAKTNTAVACIEGFFPEDTFAPTSLASSDELMAGVCATTDLRNAKSILHQEVLAHAEGKPTPGLVSWGTMGWYQLPLTAAIRRACCTGEGQATQLPRQHGMCAGLAPTIEQLVDSPPTQAELESRGREYAGAVRCLYDAKRQGAYGYEYRPSQRNRQEFQRWLQRGRDNTGQPTK